MANIEGTVEDDSGNAVDGASVAAIPQGRDSGLRTTTNSSGEFSFDNTDPEEDYHLAVRWDDGTDQWHATAAPYTPGAVQEDDLPLVFALQTYTTPANDAVDFALSTFTPPARAEVSTAAHIGREVVDRNVVGRVVVR